MCRLRAVGWLVVITVCGFTSELHADFISFFDHAPGTGTHINTLVFSEIGSGNSGFFTNANDGITTPAILSVTISNDSSAGDIVKPGSAAGVPAIGTPAYQTFNGFVDFQGTPGAAVQIPSNNFVVFTISNLNPTLRYSFKGSAVRGGADYTNRWTKITILGATSAAAAHTANALTSVKAPADLGPNDTAICFGQNHLPNQGDMAVWDDINPGPDGMFQVVCTRYTGYVPTGTSLAGASYGYGITGIRLQEFFPDPTLITGGPSPSSASVDQGQNVSFQVNVSGTAPKFQWFRDDGQPLRNAVTTNTATLTLTNIDLANAGAYRVRVFNSISSTVSDPANLTVTADRIAPTVFAGLGYADRTNFVVTFSEPLDTTKALQASAFQVHLSSGGGALPVFRAAFTNGTNVLLSTTTPRTASLNYSVSASAGAVMDRFGNASTAGEVPISAQVLLLSFSGTQWKFRSEGTDLGTSWYLDPAYDDSSWSNGVSVFDGKTPQPPGRTSIGGFAVTTQLPLTNGLWPNTTGVTPTYYFRAHFTLPTTPDHVLSLKLRTLVDDFDDFFLNQQEVYRNPGYPAAPAFGYSGGTAVVNAAVAGPFDVDASRLLEGNNIAAVMVNQATAASTDVTFAYELLATIDRFTAAPRLVIGPDPSSPGHILIQWDEGGGQLYEASVIDAAGSSWTIVSGVTGTSHSFVPSGAQKFYTIRQ